MEEGVQAGYIYIRLNKKKDKDINVSQIRNLIKKDGNKWNVLIEDNDIIFYKKWRKHENNNK